VCKRMKTIGAEVRTVRKVSWQIMRSRCKTCLDTRNIGPQTWTSAEMSHHATRMRAETGTFCLLVYRGGARFSELKVQIEMVVDLPPLPPGHFCVPSPIKKAPIWTVVDPVKNCGLDNYSPIKYICLQASI